MTTEATHSETSSSEVVRAPGEALWSEGEQARPLLIRQGVVAYRRGNVAIGLLGPGHIALPVPGIPGPGVAATELVAITETTATEADGGAEDRKALTASSQAVVT